MHSRKKAHLRVVVRARPSKQDPCAVTGLLSSTAAGSVLTVHAPSNGAAASRRGHERELSFAGVTVETLESGSDQSSIGAAAVKQLDVHQSHVYDLVGRPLVDHALAGFDTVAFAYGQTASGKTHSVFGRAGAEGLAPRAVRALFGAARSGAAVRVTASLLELYCGQLRDLSVDEDAAATPLELHEDSAGKVWVKHLQELEFARAEDLLEWLDAGLARCSVEATRSNAASSRAHTVLTVRVEVTAKGKEAVLGSLTLVDLAGSERVERGTDAKRVQEAKSINSSLSALENVLNSLARQDDTHVPYRNSKLTRLLQGVLSGNSFACLLATVSQDAEDYDETVRTIMFADRCKNVHGTMTVNYADDEASLRELVEKQQRRIESLLEEVGALNEELSAKKAYHQKQLDMVNVKFAKRLSVGDATAGSGQLSSRSAVSTASGAGGLSTAAGGGGGRGVTASASVSSHLADLLEASGMRVNRRVASDPAKLASAALKKLASLDKKLQRRNEQHEQLQARMHEEQERTQTEIIGYRNTIADLQQALADERSRNKALARERKAQHERDLNELREASKRSAAENRAQLEEMRRLYHSTSQRSALNEIRQEHRAALSKVRESMARDRDAQLANLTEQYEYLLEDRTSEVKKFAHDFERYRTEVEGAIDLYKREATYLYEYIFNLTALLRRIDAGEYPVRERLGIRVFTVPSHVREGVALQVERCHSLKANIRKLEDVIERVKVSSAHEQQPYLTLEEMRRQPKLQGTGTGASAQSSTDVEANSSRASLQHYKVANLLEHPQSFVEETGRRDTSKDRQRRAVQEQHGRDAQALREEVLNELASHQTVQYIRELEDQRDSYKRLLAEERQRVQSLLVAQRSQERVMERTLKAKTLPQVRPGSAVRVRPGTGLAVSKAQTRRHIREQLRSRTSQGFRGRGGGGGRTAAQFY